MRLSDHEIRRFITEGAIDFAPSVEDFQIQPASVDLRIDSVKGKRWRMVDGQELVWIEANEFVLGSTLEVVGVDHRVEHPRLCAEVKGKSSFARLGLMVECAGFIDPGFRGQITLEIKNISAAAVPIYKDQRICQITFTRLGEPADRSYGSIGLGSHYQGQMGVTKSWMERGSLRRT